jgi:ribosomal protein L40E
MSGDANSRVMRDPLAFPSNSRRSICGQCNTTNEIGARHCVHCGALLAHPIGFLCPTCQFDNLPGDAYCASCGAPLPSVPYLVAADSGLRIRLFDAQAHEAILGRFDPLSGVTPDVNLEPFIGPLGGLSRRHTRLFVRDGQFWAEDLHSVNLTYLNNQKIDPEQPQRLTDGDLLRLGNLTLIFRVG